MAPQITDQVRIADLLARNEFCSLSRTFSFNSETALTTPQGVPEDLHPCRQDSKSQKSSPSGHQASASVKQPLFASRSFILIIYPK